MFPSFIIFNGNSESTTLESHRLWLFLIVDKTFPASLERLSFTAACVHVWHPSTAGVGGVQDHQGPLDRGPKGTTVMLTWHGKPQLLTGCTGHPATCPWRTKCKKVDTCGWTCEWLHFRRGIQSRAFFRDLSREPRRLTENRGSPPPSFHLSHLQLSLQRPE